MNGQEEKQKKTQIANALYENCSWIVIWLFGIRLSSAGPDPTTRPHKRKTLSALSISRFVVWTSRMNDEIVMAK